MPDEFDDMLAPNRARQFDDEDPRYLSVDLESITLPWVALPMRNVDTDVSQLVFNEMRMLELVYSLGGWAKLDEEDEYTGELGWKKLLRRALGRNGWARASARALDLSTVGPLRAAALAALGARGIKTPLYPAGNHLRVLVYVRTSDKQRAGVMPWDWSAAHVHPAIFCAFKSVLWATDRQVREVTVRCEQSDQPMISDTWMVRIEQCGKKEYPAWTYKKIGIDTKGGGDALEWNDDEAIDL
jgi:hypothetical protein